MSIEKTLHKLREQIEELKNELQNFSDPTVHPTVADADNLQQRLHALLESTSVFKFQKGNSEISPSFNLHAKVSAKAESLPITTTDAAPGSTSTKVQEPESVKPVEPAPSLKHNEVIEPTTAAAESTTIKPEPAVSTPQQKNLAALTVGLNDKFRFINELFLQNAAEYNIVLEQINTLQTWTDAEIYISSLKNVYGWKESHETFKYFCSVVRRRYDV